MRFFISTFLISLSLITNLYADSGEVVTGRTFKYDNLTLGWPDQKGTIVNRAGYAFCYSEKHEQPLWVMYKLTKAEVINKVCKRRDNFRKDPLVPTGSALLEDYKGTGYDRGHLAPAADMAWSEQAMSESFYLSNMSPQKGSLNRGRWKDLETLVRNWAVANDEVYVITGPIIRPNHATIGPNKVTVPQWYYKIVLDVKSPGLKGIGFLMPNRKAEKECSAYAVTIDKIEEITGLDFFERLDDSLETKLEGSFDLSQWNFNPNAYIYKKAMSIPKAQKPASTGKYWITSSSKKRHNSRCKNYKKTKGYQGSATDGVACKICGG
jgi:endonuclease G, mitochondrial